MALQFHKYRIEGVGKILKDTKKKHTWSFSFKQEPYKLEVWDSLVSHKLKVEVQKKLVFNTRVTPVEKKKGLEFQFRDLAIKIKKVNDSLYELFINYERFLSKTTVENKQEKKTEKIETKKIDKKITKKEKKAKKNGDKSQGIFDDIVMFEEAKVESDSEDFINFEGFEEKKKVNTDFSDFGFDNIDVNPSKITQSQPQPTLAFNTNKEETKENYSQDFLHFDFSEKPQKIEKEEEKIKNDTYELYFKAEDEGEKTEESPIYESIASVPLKKKQAKFNFEEASPSKEKKTERKLDFGMEEGFLDFNFGENESNKNVLEEKKDINNKGNEEKKDVFKFDDFGGLKNKEVKKNEGVKENNEFLDFQF